MNLIEGLLEEIERNIGLVEVYESIGQAGVFAKTMIQADINEAKKAIAENDVIAMISAVSKLKGNKE